MKPGIVILLLSGFGLALLTGILLLARTPAPATVPQVVAAVAHGTNPVLPDPAPSARGASFRWSSLESTDYKEYIANLRGIGCPQDTIRDIIVADISKLYAPREAPFKTKLADQDATESLNIAARRVARQATLQQRKQLHEIQKEKNALLKQLLGITLPLEPLGAVSVRHAALFEVAFNALPSEKREAVRAIQENYWLAADALGDQYTQKRTADNRAEYKRLNTERNAQLARVLTAEEFDQYEMRTSNVGVVLRESLADFHPSEAEYRAIWRAQKPSDEPNERPKPADAQIKAALGEQRFAEYERSQDATYRSLTQLVERYGLSSETARKGYEIQKTYREQQEKAHDDSALTPQQRKETLAALKAEFDRSMVETFGETAARAFQRYGIHDFDADGEEE